MKNALPLVLIALWVLSGSATAFSAAPPIQKERIVSVGDLHGKWQEVREKKSGAILLDVRTPGEFASGHVPGAINIPSDSPSLVQKKWPDPETEIWVYCHTQNRSVPFASSLRKAGYRNIYTVDGGIIAWTKAGYPVDRKR